MRYVAQPNRDTPLADALAAEMRVWLVALMAWFCEALDTLPPWARRSRAVRATIAACKIQIAANLRYAAYGVRRLLVAYAFARMIVPAPPLRRQSQRGPAHGMRLAPRRASVVRRFTGGTLTGIHRGSLRQRALRLKALYDDLEPLIARTLKRLKAMFGRAIGAGVLLVAAFDVCASVAAPASAAFADTS